jgi:hypothetical protein
MTLHARAADRKPGGDLIKTLAALAVHDPCDCCVSLARRELPSQSQNRRTRAGSSAYRSASTAAVADLLQFDRANTGATLPLIRFLLDDPLYYARCPALLAENSRSVR